MSSAIMTGGFTKGEFVNIGSISDVRIGRLRLAPALWFSMADHWLVETQFDDLECRDLLHAGRTGYSYGFAALNVGLQAAAKTLFASWAASRTEGRIERMKDVMTNPPGPPVTAHASG